jgi:serine/threonine-protein kinase RsbW
VARRSGVDEALLDEVRLAVGEACSRAVEAHQEFCPGEPIRVALTGADGRFEVVVTDAAAQGGDAVPAMVPAAASAAGGQVSAGEAQGRPPGGLPPVPAELGLAVIAGLADDVEIVRTEAGLSIRMSWPSSPPA